MINTRGRYGPWRSVKMIRESAKSPVEQMTQSIKYGQIALSKQETAF